MQVQPEPSAVSSCRNPRGRQPIQLPFPDREADPVKDRQPRLPVTICLAQVTYVEKRHVVHWGLALSGPQNLPVSAGSRRQSPSRSACCRLVAEIAGPVFRRDRRGKMPARFMASSNRCTSVRSTELLSRTTGSTTASDAAGVRPSLFLGRGSQGCMIREKPQARGRCEPWQRPEPRRHGLPDRSRRNRPRRKVRAW